MRWSALIAFAVFVAFGKGGGRVGTAAPTNAWAYEANPNCLLCGLPANYQQGEWHEDHDYIGRCLGVAENARRCWSLTEAGERTCLEHVAQSDLVGWAEAMKVAGV